MDFTSLLLIVNQIIILNILHHKTREIIFFKFCRKQHIFQRIKCVILGIAMQFANTCKNNTIGYSVNKLVFIKTLDSLNTIPSLRKRMI